MVLFQRPVVARDGEGAMMLSARGEKRGKKKKRKYCPALKLRCPQ